MHVACSTCIRGTIWGGTPNAPTVASKKGPAVTLNVVTVDGETVEYAYNDSYSTPTGVWQESVNFDLGDSYLGKDVYFFARVKATGSHEASNAVASTDAVHIYQNPTISYGNIGTLTYGTSVNLSPTIELDGADLAGSEPYKMTGDLPEGLSFDKSNGNITGTPTAISSGGSVTVTVTNAEGTESEAATVTYPQVAKAANILTIQQNDVEYGTPFFPTATSNGTSPTIEYKLKDADDDTYSSEKPEYVGEYTIRATSTGHATVEDQTATKKFQITAVSRTLTTSFNSSSNAKEIGKNATIDLTSLVETNTPTMDGITFEEKADGSDAVTISGTTLTNDGTNTGDVEITVKGAAIDVNKDGKDEYNAAVDITLYLKVIDKNDVSSKITFDNGSAIYTGKELTHETAKYDGAESENITYKYAPMTAGSLSGAPTNAGTYKVTATYSSDDDFGEKTVEFIIEKAKPTGTPKFDEITEAGKTLADANLVKASTTPDNGFDVAGTVKWDDGDSTAVEANKAYGWTFTPNDEANYEKVTGNAVVWKDAGASGGEGGAYIPEDSAATADMEIDRTAARSNVFGSASTVDVTGKNRVETSLQLADQTKKALGVAKFSTIIIASGTDYPDGLGVSALSIQQKAPVLIVTPGTEGTIKKYIEDNLVEDGKVIITGGTGAVSQSMQNLLNGTDVSRLGGADRYKTNILTIKEMIANGAGKDEILIASGNDFADALSASATGKIIMIVGDKMTDEQKALLKETGFGKVTILGGTGAVSEAVENELNSTTGKTADRVGGANRIETSKLVAAKYFSGSTTNVYTKADDFADGLAGGLLANVTGSPLLLSYGAKDMTAGGRSVTLGGVK